MVLVGRQHRHGDQREPDVQACGPPTAQPRREARPQHRQHADVQRWRTVVGQVAERQQLEKQLHHADGVGPLEGEAQRKGQVAQHRNQQHEEELQHMAPQLLAAATGEEGQREEAAQRQVGHDAPSNEGNVLLPGEHAGAHVAALAGEVVGQAIQQRIGRRREQQPEVGRQGWPGAGQAGTF